MKKTVSPAAAGTEEIGTNGVSAGRADPGQLRRIRRYERLFDRASAGLRALQGAVRRFESLTPAIEALKEYYESDEWKKDFADDEAGKLPPDLKRGVLSEDGLYLLLEEIAAWEALLSEGKEDGERG